MQQLISFRRSAGVILAAVLIAGSAARAQSVDCARLRQQIAADDRGDRGGRGAQALRRMGGELARTQGYAHQLGCDGFVLFGGNPQCSGLNARVQQLQAAVAQLQAGGGGGGRSDLVARYNAYCRDGAPPQQQGGGFFDRLFGSLAPQAPQPPAIIDERPEDDDRPRGGGSQAICVRGCDGGFFPLAISSRHAPEDLTQMCQALCPGTEATVFTRAPNADIKSAVGLDGRAYMEQPNALLFQKSYTPACSCRPTGKGWAETLATAEELLDNTRRGDIVVTPEKSIELSRPATAATPAGRSTPRAPVVQGSSAPPEPAAPAASVAGRPAIRQVGPQP